MKIKSEWDFISAVKSMASPQGADLPEGLVAGIGDDCAAFAIGQNRYGLITTDLFLEDRHFTRHFSTPRQIGYKAMEGSISDIAAMGGTPRFAFTSLGMPGDTDQEYAQSLFQGMLLSAERCGVSIAGGDTSESGSLVLSITVYGECSQKTLVTRSGARTGQGIFVTGTVGGSMAGLEILSTGMDPEEFPELVARHREPRCRIDIAGLLVDRFAPSAMIDISDGLLSDLRHICESSGQGFIVDSEKLPLLDSLISYCEKKGCDPGAYGLQSGEEYELLFTADISPNGSEPDGSIEGCAVTLIGGITDKDFRIIERGKTIKAVIRGFNHFE